MRACLVLVAVAGCYAPTIRPGSSCDTECPGNLECVDHVCREPGAATDAPPRGDAALPDGDGPPGDDDGDGVADGMDNCPARPNGDQHDEDRDALGDACDPCPHVAGDGADGDGDGVGDACDPEPTIAKQRIRFFDPFTADLPAWQHGGGVSVSVRSNAPGCSR